MIIGFVGKSGSGKDTAVSLFLTMADLSTRKDEWVLERRSFADALKNSSAAVLDVDRQVLENHKNNPNAFVITEIDGIEIARQTFREHWQRYGTEGHREIKGFGPDVWLNACLPSDLDHSRMIIAISDVRFLNEADHIKKGGGYLVRVIGPDNETGVHASEVELEQIKEDHILRNHIRDDNYANLVRELEVLARRYMVFDPVRS